MKRAKEREIGKIRAPELPHAPGAPRLQFRLVFLQPTVGNLDERHNRA
jgi:hypothetical protein